MALDITRKPSTFEPYDHICSFDDAIDSEHADCDHDKWMDTGDDTFLPRKTKKKPTIFTLRHLSGRAHRRIADISTTEGNAEACYQIVRYSLSAIKNPDIPLELERDDDGCEVVPEGVMDMLWMDANGRRAIFELASRVYREDFNTQKKST
jgi:hypothetical protein